MFLYENTSRQLRLAVTGKHRNRGLQNDRAGVKVIVDHMDCRTVQLHAGLEGSAMRIQAGK